MSGAYTQKGTDVHLQYEIELRLHLGGHKNVVVALQEDPGNGLEARGIDCTLLIEDATHEPGRILRRIRDFEHKVRKINEERPEIYVQPYVTIVSAGINARAPTYKVYTVEDIASLAANGHTSEPPETAVLRHLREILESDLVQQKEIYLDASGLCVAKVRLSDVKTDQELLAGLRDVELRMAWWHERRQWRILVGEGEWDLTYICSADDLWRVRHGSSPRFSIDVLQQQLRRAIEPCLEGPVGFKVQMSPQAIQIAVRLDSLKTDSLKQSVLAHLREVAEDYVRRTDHGTSLPARWPIYMIEDEPSVDPETSSPISRAIGKTRVGQQVLRNRGMTGDLMPLYDALTAEGKFMGRTVLGTNVSTAPSTNEITVDLSLEGGLPELLDDKPFYLESYYNAKLKGLLYGLEIIEVRHDSGNNESRVVLRGVYSSFMALAMQPTPNNTKEINMSTPVDSHATTTAMDANAKPHKATGSTSTLQFDHGSASAELPPYGDLSNGVVEEAQEPTILSRTNRNLVKGIKVGGGVEALDHMMNVFERRLQANGVDTFFLQVPVIRALIQLALPTIVMFAIDLDGVKTMIPEDLHARVYAVADGAQQSAMTSSVEAAMTNVLPLLMEFVTTSQKSGVPDLSGEDIESLLGNFPMAGPATPPEGVAVT